VEPAADPIIGGQKIPALKSVVPQKYHDKSKPLFHVKVEKGGKNHFVLELNSK
jgi:hypothetical protein